MLCLEIVNNLIDNICDALGVRLGGGIHLVAIFDKHTQVVPEEERWAWWGRMGGWWKNRFCMPALPECL